MDNRSEQSRSALMARIRGKNTVPERLVRSGLHRAGLRFRLHHRDLPGRPDIVLPRWKAVVFVHGCFWHGHVCKAPPKSRTEFWSGKIAKNRDRDTKAFFDLQQLGWRPFVIWECGLKPRVRNDTIAELIAMIKSS